MVSCRILTCVTLVPEGNVYCENHGGRERYERELKAMAAKKAEPNSQPKKKFVPEHPKGQAVPHDQGLAQFSNETDEQRETRLNAERMNREKREAEREKRRQERLEARPEKGKGGKSNREGTGTSKKARQQHKKNRKRGATGGRFR